MVVLKAGALTNIYMNQFTVEFSFRLSSLLNFYKQNGQKEAIVVVSGRWERTSYCPLKMDIVLVNMKRGLFLPRVKVTSGLWGHAKQAQLAPLCLGSGPSSPHILQWPVLHTRDGDYLTSAALEKPDVNTDLECWETNMQLTTIRVWLWRLV